MLITERLHGYTRGPWITALYQWVPNIPITQFYRYIRKAGHIILVAKY